MLLQQKMLLYVSNMFLILLVALRSVGYPCFVSRRRELGVIYCGLGLLIRFLAICMFCFNDWMTFGTFATDCLLVHLLQWLVDGYDWVCSKKNTETDNNKTRDACYSINNKKKNFNSNICLNFIFFIVRLNVAVASEDDNIGGGGSRVRWQLLLYFLHLIKN